MNDGFDFHREILAVFSNQERTFFKLDRKQNFYIAPTEIQESSEWRTRESRPLDLRATEICPLDSRPRTHSFEIHEKSNNSNPSVAV